MSFISYKVRECIANYFCFYNSEKYHRALKKMTPDEFRVICLLAS
ncbi:IS3 family transposase [Paenibacillus sp. Y412MC10]